MRIPQVFETLWADVKFAARGLRKSPGFLAVVVLSLSLGIAANSTIFSVLNALLYRPLPYPQPESLVVIWQVDQAHPDSMNAPPIAENVDWTKQNHVFEDISLSSFTDQGYRFRAGRAASAAYSICYAELFRSAGREADPRADF